METQAGIRLTDKEIKLIESFKRLAKRWQKDGKRLWLYSAAGSLCVMMDEDESNPNPQMIDRSHGEGVNPDNQITSIDIRNDGGDW